MKTNRYMFLVILTLIYMLAACSQPSPELVGKGKMGFVTDILDKRLLIGDTIYSISKDTHIQTSDGQVFPFEDLELGMKIKPWYRGAVEESFPARATAELLIVIDDEQSVKEKKAVLAAINGIKKGVTDRFIVLDIMHDSHSKIFEIEMMSRSNLDSKFVLTVDEEDGKILYQE